MKVDSMYYYCIYTAVDKGHTHYAYTHKLLYDEKKAIKYALKHNSLVIKCKTLSNKTIVGEILDYKKNEVYDD